MAIRDMRHEKLKGIVMLSGQYQKDQTEEAYDYNQALLNEQFETLGNVYTIEEERIRGSELYTPIRASVSLVDNIRSKTNNVDDFRSLFFKDAKYDSWIGKRYKFGNNIWITINVSSINTLMNSSLVQRCNNVLRWISEDGILFEEPCIIGNKITSTTTEQGTHIQVIDGELSVVLQYNEYSKNIGINQRFVIGGQAYTVRMVDLTKRTSTYDSDSIGIITLELDIANIGVNDDIDKIIEEDEDKDNVVLNGNIVTPDVRDLTYFPPYNIGVYEVYNYANNVKLEDKFTFEFFDAIRDKAYRVLSVSDNGFTIEALDYSKIPLVVQYTNTTTNEIGEFTIQLRGVL